VNLKEAKTLDIQICLIENKLISKARLSTDLFLHRYCDGPGCDYECIQKRFGDFFDYDKFSLLGTQFYNITNIDSLLPDVRNHLTNPPSGFYYENKTEHLDLDSLDAEIDSFASQNPNIILFLYIDDLDFQPATLLIQIPDADNVAHLLDPEFLIRKFAEFNHKTTKLSILSELTALSQEIAIDLGEKY